MNTLCIDNYVFRVGDYVETKDGEVGYISTFIHSNNGENTIFVNYKDGKTQGYKFSENKLLRYFNRVGLYNFTNDSADEKDIKPLVKSWVLESSNSNGEYYFDSREVIKKINELINAVNDLRRKLNDKV